MGKMDNDLRRTAEIPVTQNPGERRKTLTRPYKSRIFKEIVSPRGAALTASLLTAFTLIIAVAAAGSIPSDEADAYIGHENYELLPGAPASDGGAGRYFETVDESASDIPVLLSAKMSDTAESGTDSADTAMTGTAAPAAAAPETTEQAEKTERFTVTFEFYGRDSISCVTAPATVAEIAEKAGISFDESERLNIDLDAMLYSDTTISADTVTYGTASVTETIDYDVEYVDVQTIPNGTTRVAEYGSEGERVVEYDCTYVNGVEVARTERTSYINSYPKNQVVYRGVGGTFTGADGVTRSYSYYIDVKATVYYTGGICATGVPADETVIAVDPSVIALGTKVYVSGSYADFGVRTAADTGGSIKGNIIDICISPSSPYAGGFGFKPMRVYILN